LETCTTNAAMCCWPKDRQANDNNGNCAKEYDVNCVDKDVADNTDLCFVDLERGNASTGSDSGVDTTLVYPGDNDQGEGAIHCHGLAWSNDVNDMTARYKGNNLFFVSMYDHMYQRGYVKNIPGAPMCGCVEQMPTVTRSDCTQVDLTETIVIEFDGSSFKAKLTSIYVDFNACQGINNRNNDLWAYMARLYYQGDITPKQFGEAGRIITNTNCNEATKFELDQKQLTVGYDHDTSVWTNVAGREQMKLNGGYGHRAFEMSLTPSTLDTDNTHYGIVYRACEPCIRTHKKIFYRRRSPIPEGFSLINNILHWRSNSAPAGNKWNDDFSLHSTYEDALNDANPWQCKNDNFRYADTFYGRCSPDGREVKNQRSQFQSVSDSEKQNVAYYVNKPEEGNFELLETTAIGTYWAGGMALQNNSDGTIYMTGSGRDIYGDDDDDFNYYSQPVDGDHTAIVHAGSISSPEPRSWSKSGIMFRTSLESNSAYFSIYLTGSNGVCMQGRMTAGEWYKHWGCINGGATSAWLKVEKRMNMYTSFVGAEDAVDGTIVWTEAYSTVLPGIGESYNVGLAITSNRWYSQEVVFTGYDVDAYYFPSAAPSISSQPTIYIPGSDIGKGVVGSASQATDGSWVVKAKGRDIWARSDSFYYVHFKPRSGDVTAELLVDSFDRVESWQKAGIMFRESLSSNSRHYSLFATGDQGVSTQYRQDTGGNTAHSTQYALKARPVWLQVSKVGNQFTSAYRYDDATEWTYLYSSTMDFDVDNGSFYAGIANTSNNVNKVATLEVGEFIVTDTA